LKNISRNYRRIETVAVAWTALEDRKVSRLLFLDRKALQEKMDATPI